MASPLKPQFHRAMMAQDRELSTPKPFVALLYTDLTRGGRGDFVFFASGFKVSSLADEPIEVHEMAADHDSLLVPPAVAGLAEAPSGLELPADRPRPPVPSFCGATCALRLPAAVTASLRQVAGREGVSLDVLLLAGLAALLARYSGAEDLVIGAAGPTSLLPLRIQWTGDPPFERLVASANGALSAALAKADLPFEAPLQVIFSGLGAGPGASGERKLAVDLAFSVREIEGGGGEP